MIGAGWCAGRPPAPALAPDATAFLGTPVAWRSPPTCEGGPENADVLIDFTRPEGTLAHMAGCAGAGGEGRHWHHRFYRCTKAELDAFAQRTAIMFSPNMSVGVNVTLKLLQMAAQAMATGYDIEIIEAHHRH